MPLTKEQRAAYGPDWPRISRERREACGWRCERCGAEQGKPIHPHIQIELAIDAPVLRRRGNLRNRVVLTVAHLDHNPCNHQIANLAVMCQRCHLRHDRLDNLRRRRRPRSFPCQIAIWID